MKFIGDFAARFGVKIDFDEKNIVEKENRYFLLNDRLKGLIGNDFFYAGVYLGMVKNGVFLPSFNLLKIIAEKEGANKVFVDERSAWLFICGRDIFKRGITKIEGSRKRGDYTLVLNRHGECLGFGIILKDLDAVEKGVVVKNVLDIGDFLRRERRHPEE
ncbi:MAG: hypothetical protein ACPL0C_03860 [Candidatus Bathyarchaeales archaeon]